MNLSYKINDEKANELQEKYNLPISINQLTSILSTNLTETEMDTFNAGQYQKIQIITDWLEVYDQTGTLLTEFERYLEE